MKQKYIVRLRHEWESYQTVEVQAEDKGQAVELALKEADAAASHDEGGVDATDCDFWDFEEEPDEEDAPTFRPGEAD